jgi:Tol biopolymer transport system component
MVYILLKQQVQSSSKDDGNSGPTPQNNLKYILSIQRQAADKYLSIVSATTK